MQKFVVVSHVGEVDCPPSSLFRSMRSDGLSPKIADSKWWDSFLNIGHSPSALVPTLGSIQLIAKLCSSLTCYTLPRMLYMFSA